MVRAPSRYLRRHQCPLPHLWALVSWLTDVVSSDDPDLLLQCLLDAMLIALSTLCQLLRTRATADIGVSTINLRVSV